MTNIQTLEACAPSTASGKVTVTGTLIPATRAQVTLLCFGSYYKQTKTVDISGNYSFTGMPVGKICVVVVKTPFPLGCQSVDPSEHTFFYEGGNVMNRNFTLTCNAQCSDGIDNDQDGDIDYPNDSGCGNPQDNDENEKPVITLNGDSVINLRVGRNYVELGATVDDPEEGDITGNLVIGGDTVDTSATGTYMVTYNAQDTPGLSADQVTRTVNVTPLIYGAYCGDGVINQWWEVCDSGNDPQIVGCSDQCQYVIPGCREHVFVKTSLFNIQNVKQDADASTDIYFRGKIIPSGVWEVMMYDGIAVIDTDNINTYENIPNVGVTMQSIATGTITTRHFGSHQNDGTREHLEGTIEFYGSAAVGVGNDTSGNNIMENWGPDMVAQKAINASKDAAWIDSEVSNFWTTVTVADDSFFTYWDPIPVCEDPNQSPVADAGADQTVLTGSVLLGGTGSYDTDGTIVSYLWEFGDSATSTGATTTHSYIATGTYPVVLTVEDNDGATSTDIVVITVVDPEPTYGMCINKINADTDDGIPDWTVGIAVKNACEEGQEWADMVMEYFPQGTIDPSRKDETKALGYTDGNETSGTENFVTLGIDGWMTFRFNNKITNGAGDDVQVYETSWGSPVNYPEYAEIFASQDYSTWVSLGTTMLDGTFDLGTLPWAKYIKIVDKSVIGTVYDGDKVYNGDGYDVDAVKALNCEAYTTISEGETDGDGEYCVSNLASSTPYIVYEGDREGWSPVDITVDGISVSIQSNLVFDVYTVISLDEGTTTVDFYNREIPRCGDKICNGDETCSTCSQDCGECEEPEPYCGDGSCNGNETCSSCPSDCKECYIPPTTDPESTGGGGYILPVTFQVDPTCVVEKNGKTTIEWILSKDADGRVVYDPDGHNINFGESPNYGYASSSELHNMSRHQKIVVFLEKPGTYYFRAVSDARIKGYKEVLKEFECVFPEPVIIPDEPTIVEELKVENFPDYYIAKERIEKSGWVENNQKTGDWLGWFFNDVHKEKYGFFDPNEEYTITSESFATVVRYHRAHPEIFAAFEGNQELIRKTYEGNVWESTRRTMVAEAMSIVYGIDWKFPQEGQEKINDVNDKKGRNDHKSEPAPSIPPVTLAPEGPTVQN